MRLQTTWGYRTYDTITPTTSRPTRRMKNTFSTRLDLHRKKGMERYLLNTSTTDGVRLSTAGEY